MDTDFTFEKNFAIVPRRANSYTIEQGQYSRAFSDLESLVEFLIQAKHLFYEAAARGYPPGYEHFDRTGLPKEKE